MAVNLRATATLNTKPYRASLRELANAHKRLNKTLISGGAAGGTGKKDPVLVQAHERERASKAANAAAAQGAASQRRNNRAVREGTIDAKAYNKALVETYTHHARNIKAMGRMTAAQMSQANAVRKYQRAVEAQAAGRASGLAGPAMGALDTRATAAAERLAGANARVARENDRVAKSAARAAAAQQRQATAQSAVASSGAKAASGLAAQRYLYHDLSRQLATTAVGLAALPALSLIAAGAWEKSFANVVRTGAPEFTNVQQRVDGLRASLVQMVEAMPTSFADVTEIATLANQMGIATNQVSDFTRAVTMFSATSGVSVDIAATAFGRLTSILGDSAVGFNVLSDSILKVGVNSVATEEEIINVTTQISSIAAQAGFSAQDMIGLAGAMASVRVPPELSRGVITRVFGTISRATADGTDGLQNFARISGMSAKEFQRSWGTEGSAETLNAFLHGLKDLGPQAETELRNLGITSVRDVPVLLRLANAADAEGNVGELLTQTINDAYDAAGETQRQYTIMADTVAAKFKVLGNNIMSFFDAVGSSGLGPLGDILDGLSGGIRNLSRLVRDGEADWLGWAFVISGILSVVALLGSAVAKVMAGIATVRHAGSLMSGMFGGAAKEMQGVYRYSDQTGGALKQATKQGSKLGRVMKAAGGFIAVAAIVGATMLYTHLRDAGVEASKVAENIAKIKFTTDGSEVAHQMDAIFRSLDVSNLGVSGAGEGLLDNLFGSSNMANNVDEYKNSLEELSKSRADALFSADNWFSLKSMLIPDSATASYDRTSLSVQRFGDALGDLADGGNMGQAISMLKEMGLTKEQLNNQFEKSGEFRDSVDALLDMGGIEPTAANRYKLINGELREITDSLYEINGLENVDLGDLFEGDEAAIGELQKSISGTVEAFFDLKGARSAALDADTGKLDFDKFMDNMRKNAKEQEKWAANMRKLGRVASQDLMKELIAAGPEMNDVVAGLLKSPEALADAEEYYANNVADRVASGIETSMAAAAKLKGLLGDKLGSALASDLSDSELSSLYEGFENVGFKAAEKIAQGLSNGDYSVQQAIDMLKAQQVIELDADLNVDPALLSFNTIKALIDGTVTTMQLDALGAPAEGKVWDVVRLANGTTAFVELDSDGKAAEGGIAKVVDKAGKVKGEIKLTANDASAWNTARSWNGTTVATAYVDIVGRSKVEAHSGGRGAKREADGGVLETYAKGGIRESHIAQIAPAGVNRIWGEPETGGEAYIPLAKSKRFRSEAILNNVASRFGMALVRNNTAQYADGGMYQAQQISRRYTAGAAAYAGNPGPKLAVGDVTFTQPNQKDQFREFNRYLNRAARGL